MRESLLILIAISLVLSIAMGLRQSLGLFLQPLTRDLSIAVADFTVAIAVQNVAWGILQPIAGALVNRWGFRSLLMAGAAFYVAGLVVLALAQGTLGIVIGAGVLIGAALASTASAMALAVASRAVPASARSSVLGIVTAAGSLGAVIAAPLGQYLSDSEGWRVGIAGFAAMAALMLPAAWVAGRVDRIALPARGEANVDVTARAALASAFHNRSFMLMAGAYFVCGMQLIFLATHLPSYLAICGMDAMLSAQALATIAIFNVAGSLFFGWAGGRWSKQFLLGLLYTARSIVLATYFAFPPTPAGTLLFAACMGFLWLGVGPLISGSVVEMFGLRWQAMIQGIAFMSHQAGSFIGALGGGVLFDLLGSYDLAWKIGVATGLAAGVAQMLFATPRPPPLGPPRSDSPRLDPVLGGR